MGDPYVELARHMGQQNAESQRLPESTYNSARRGSAHSYKRLLKKYLAQLQMQGQGQEMGGLSALVKLFTVLRANQNQAQVKQPTGLDYSAGTPTVAGADPYDDRKDYGYG